MVKPENEKKRPPPIGMTKDLVLYTTPDGWRHSVHTVDGAMLCGRLDVPPDADPQDARDAMAAMQIEIAREFHGVDIEVNWEPPQKPGWWTAQITIAAGNEPATPDTGGSTAS
jgi:hypothetical protein